MRVYFDFRDWWVGAYVADHATYVCVVPCLVMRFGPRDPRRLPQVLREVAAERRRQDDQHGGAYHDDAHTADEWEDLIRLRVSGARRAERPFRDRMVEVAALAVAAIESHDRRQR